ncbi:MAG: hypothetical protein HC912_00350 [Saprospiraceae bacterium]|nr:hypothetical protein [Saprospiraceae bacterium]
MNFEEFTQNLTLPTPPDHYSQALKALWYDKLGDWEKAHNLAQDIHTPIGAWIHAYLHRKEGDIWNADYWYQQAGRKRPNQTLDQEWQAMVASVLAT